MNAAVKPVEYNSVVSSPSNDGGNKGSRIDPEVRLVLSLLERGKQYRGQFDEDWQTRIDYYNGKQYRDKSNKQSRPVMNIIRQMIQATIPILTDQRPGFGVEAAEPSDYEFAQLVGELIESWWSKSSITHTLIEVIHDSMLLDAGILKVTWDTDSDYGLGDVCVERVDPRDIYVPFGSKDFTKNCGWVIQRSQKQVGELRRKFPKMADKIKPDAQDDKREKYNKGMELKLVSPTDQHDKRTNTINESVDTRQMCDVIECWIDDETLVEEISENENGEEVKTVKKKYPKGKLITILPGQMLVLQSVESPYSHGMKPYVRIIDTILPGEFWGEGEAKPLMHTQRLINKTLQHMFDSFQLMTNPLYLVKKGSGVNINNITNRISQVLEVNDGIQDPVVRDFPPALQNGILDLYNMLIRQVEQESGITEITQGRKPQGVTAAAAIENLAEASQTRIRLKERNLQVSLEQLGKQIIALMMQFYREPRVVRITNKNDQWPQYREIYFEETQDENGDSLYSMNSLNYNYDTLHNNYVAEPNMTTTQPTKGMLDIKVKAGTAMPWAKTTRANIAFRLFDMQVIDDKELLEVLEWPNADEIVDRMKQRREAAAQQPPPAQ